MQKDAVSLPEAISCGKVKCFIRPAEAVIAPDQKYECTYDQKNIGINSCQFFKFRHEQVLRIAIMLKGLYNAGT